MDILILGGTRFFGYGFLNYCNNLGLEITYLSRRFLDKKAQITGVVGERKDAVEQLNGRHFDAIVDFNAYSWGDVAHTLKYIDTDKYVFISTHWASQFKASDRCFSQIEHKYTQNKIDAEKYLKNHCATKCRLFILRFPIILGLGDHTGRLDYLASRIADECPITVDKTYDGCISITFLNDAIRLLEKVIFENDTNFFIGEAIPANNMVYHEFVRGIGEAIGKESFFINKEREEIQANFCMFYDVDPFWRERSFHSTLLNAYEYFNLKTTPYSTWLKSVLDNYPENRDKLRKQNFVYHWETKEYKVAEKKWNLLNGL